jgi:hypothetical protein
MEESPKAGSIQWVNEIWEKAYLKSRQELVHKEEKF